MMLAGVMRFPSGIKFYVVNFIISIIPRYAIRHAFYHLQNRYWGRKQYTHGRFLHRL